MIAIIALLMAILMPALREVVIDSIMGVPASNRKYGRNFIDVPGGIYQQSHVYDTTSHVSKEVPTGGNVAYLDGHGEWRAFNPEMENGVAKPRYGSNPGFFW